MLDKESRARIVPFAIYISFIVIGDGLERLGVGAAELRWLYAIKISAVLAALIWYYRFYTELAWSRLSSLHLASALMAGAIVWGLWIKLDASWMQVGASAGFDPRTQGAWNWGLVAVRLAGAALVVPVMEELFWRSFLMRWVQSPDFLRVAPGSVKLTAFAVTALLFGVEHNLWFAGVVAGVAYGLLYRWSGNLWTAILAHGVTNGLLGIWVISTGEWTYW